MASATSRQRASTPSTPLLSTFQKHIEDMRNLVLCKVCIKPLYEPYNLGCGHTYCYTCLASWFGGANKRKRKTCPDCRAQVNAQPAPNYLLRDLVHMFISRIELLPEDETTKEHDDAKQAEALQIEADRGPGGEGLFKGAFHSRMLQIGRRAIRDDDDGVDRCPVCTWELEEGKCTHCGYSESDVDDDDDDDDDNDDDDDDDDDSDDTRALPSPSIITIDSALDGDLDPDDHDLEDDYDEDEDNDDDEAFAHPDHRLFRTYHQRLDVAAACRTGHPHRGHYHESTISDDDEAEVGGHQHPYFRRARHAESEDQSDGDHTAVPDEHSYDTATNEDDETMASSYDDSDDESEIITGARRQRHELTQRSARDEPLSEAEPNSPGSFYADALAAGDPDHGFSPIRSMSPASSNLAPMPSPTPNTQSDEDHPLMAPSQPAASNRIPRRPARVVISSDEESEGHSWTPPRPVAERRAHLLNQRARRGGRSRGGGLHRPNFPVNEARRRFQEEVRR